MRSLGFSYGIPALIVSLVLFSSAWFYGQTFFYRDPGSIFFDPTRAHERKYSLHREIESAQFRYTTELKLLHISQNTSTSSSGEELIKAGPDPQLCVVFITVARDVPEQYVHLAVSSALTGLEPSERADLDVKVYFADIDPTSHPAWHSWLSNTTDGLYSSSDLVSPAEQQQLLNFSAASNWQQKSGFDYAIALETCLHHSSAPYIAVLEGDVIVADGWVARTLLALRDVETQIHVRGLGTKWLFMRLFNGEGAIGWASKELLGNNVIWISLGGAAVLSLTLKMLRGRRYRGFIHLDNATIVIVSLLALPAFVILFFQAGKSSLLPPRPGVRMERFGCCTQGMVYPREHLPGLVDSLRLQSDASAYDISINRYAAANDFELFALYPVQVQHLGFHSAINIGRKPIDVPWSMAFEDLQVSSLRNDHMRMVKKLYNITI